MKQGPIKTIYCQHCGKPRPVGETYCTCREWKYFVSKNAVYYEWLERQLPKQGELFEEK